MAKFDAKSFKIRNDNPDKGTETLRKHLVKRLQMRLEMITPIRGRKLSIKDYAKKTLVIRNDNPNKGTETINF